MTDRSERDSDQIASSVLRRALTSLRRTESSEDERIKDSVQFGRAWIGALHEGFLAEYPEDSVSVFSQARRAGRLTESWRRSEFLFDVSVVEVERRPAPLHPSATVPVVTRCLWQVESEMALDAASVAEDLGKLVLGRSCWSLLVVARPKGSKRFEEWKDFIAEAGTAVAGQLYAEAGTAVAGQLYVAFMETYAGQGWKAYRQGGQEILLHKMMGGRLVGLGTVA